MLQDDENIFECTFLMFQAVYDFFKAS